jgi:hypothetical protein
VDDDFNVVGIIDWEYSGFYSNDFEAPLWTVPPPEAENYFDIDADKIPQLVKFLSQKQHRRLWLRDPSTFLLCGKSKRMGFED